MKGMHGIIFSYEKQTDLRELIANRIHGSIPFAGDYRVIDFVLSAMVNAGITDVGVIMHGKCQSMLDHLGSGKSWDLSRNHGGLTLLPAFAYNESRGAGGQYRGKVEALAGVINYLKGIRQDYVLLSDSDLVINLPLEDVLRRHIETGADMTAVCTSIPGDVSDTYFTLDETGRITDTAYDVFAPAGYRCLNMFILSKKLLLQMVTECASRNQFSFRHYILQDMGKKYHSTPTSTTATPPGSTASRATISAAWSCWIPLCGRRCSARSGRCTARRTTPPPAISTPAVPASTP